MLGQYFGPPSNGKGKGILGAPPGVVPKDAGAANADQVPAGPGDVPLTEGGSVHQSNRAVDGSDRVGRLECPKFDGTDFRGWWAKLERFFEAEGTPEASKVCTMMLSLEGRALEWSHFYARRNGGICMLTWADYARFLQGRFGSSFSVIQ